MGFDDLIQSAVLGDLIVLCSGIAVGSVSGYIIFLERPWVIV